MSRLARKNKAVNNKGQKIITMLGMRYYLTGMGQHAKLLTDENQKYQAYEVTRYSSKKEQKILPPNRKSTAIIASYYLIMFRRVITQSFLRPKFVAKFSSVICSPELQFFKTCRLKIPLILSNEMRSKLYEL